MAAHGSYRFEPKRAQNLEENSDGDGEMSNLLETTDRPVFLWLTPSATNAEWVHSLSNTNRVGNKTDWKLNHSSNSKSNVASRINNRELITLAGPNKSPALQASLLVSKIARCVRCGDCDFRRSPRSAYKIADIWHISYRRSNSPAFAKSTRSHDFLPFPLRFASKI